MKRAALVSGRSAGSDSGSASLSTDKTGVTQAEWAEMETVLSSASFERSPNLVRLLRYICTEHLKGRTEQLKEYNVGAEGLGRGADFDPTASSIVRVEFHRLRERLSAYYETEGAAHTVVIVLQPGRYAPQFVHRTSNEDAKKRSSEAAVQPQAQMPASGSRLSAGSKDRPALRRFAIWFALIGSVAILLIVVFVTLGNRNPQSNRAETEKASRSAVASSPESFNTALPEVRIVAGNLAGSSKDKEGNTWEGDRYFTGGTASPENNQENAQVIARTSDTTRFNSFRYGEFSYDIPVHSGVYELHLGFAEVQYGMDTMMGGGEGSRVFDVELNGAPILTHFDVIADVGGNRIADIRVFKNVTPAADGRVHLRFIREKDEPFVNSIELLPAPSGRFRPIRIVSQDTYFTDHLGRLWHPDSFFTGGRMALTKYATQAPADRGLFKGERFGNFSYALPVAAGRYQVTLWFSETFFGPDDPGKGGVGRRIFDVSCNGHPLLENFDIYREARGDNRAVVRTFHGLAASAQGKLLLTFVPEKDYACVSAIEVLEEEFRP